MFALTGYGVEASVHAEFTFLVVYFDIEFVTAAATVCTYTTFELSRCTVTITIAVIVVPEEVRSDVRMYVSDVDDTG